MFDGDLQDSASFLLQEMISFGEDESCAKPRRFIRGKHCLSSIAVVRRRLTQHVTFQSGQRDPAVATGTLVRANTHIAPHAESKFGAFNLPLYTES